LGWRRQQLVSIGLSVSVLVVAVYGTLRLDPINFMFLCWHIEAAWQDARAMVDSGRRDAIVSAQRAAIAAIYRVDPTMLRLMRGQTVLPIPYAISTTWAYGLRWRPLPLVLPYASYTEKLDELNARLFRSRRAPGRILRNPDGSIDGRALVWDSPAAMREMLCRYVELRVTPAWDLLGHGPNRCGHAVRLSALRARWGQTVAVPKARQAGAMVFVRVRGAGPAGLERLQTLVYRADMRFATLNGGQRVYRFVPGNAQDGLVLSVPADADYSPPYQLSLSASSLRLTKEGGQPSGRVLKLTFYEMPIRSFARVPLSPA
jgi:hypothetical protein